MKAKLKIAAKAFLAAITSPTVVKAEEGIAILVITRVLQAVGASAGLVVLVQHLA